LLGLRYDEEGREQVSVKERFDEEMDKLQMTDTHSPEFGVSYNYLDWISSLPWQIVMKPWLQLSQPVS